MPDGTWVEVPGKKGLYRFVGDLQVRIEALERARRTLVTSSSTAIRNGCEIPPGSKVVLGRSRVPPRENVG